MTTRLLLILILCGARPALAYECVNYGAVADKMRIEGGRIEHDFRGDDADAAVGLLNFLVMAPDVVLGDRVLILRNGVNAAIVVMLGRGSGHCAVLFKPVAPGIADAIASAVLNDRADAQQ